MRQFQTESDAAIPTLRLRAVAEITATLVLLLAALFGISKPLMKSARKGYRRGLGAGGRGRFVVLTAIVTLVAATVGGVAIWILYDTGLAEQRARLAETARSQAHMIEAMARFDRTYANYPAGTVSAVITQFRDAHEPVASLGFGIVVKIDLSEVRMPFIEAGGIVAGLAVLVIIIGTGFFLAVSNPIINEMHQTARRLQQAQQIGRMGDWSWDVASGKIHWSDEIYRIFGRQSGEFEPTYESFTATLHEADVERIRNSEEAAFAKGEKHSIDLGQLTGGIAHDFNNLLGIIIGNLEIMKRIAKGDEKILGRVETALKGARRGAELTKSLLGISRQDAGSTKAVSLNDLITEMREIIAKSLTGKIEVQTYLAGDLDLTEIDAGDFEDTILNLSINARDAMPLGGNLIIETSNALLDEGYVKLNPDATPGNYVMLAISDTGTGMSAETLDQVFEPFYTTKEKGKGTGLGLSMVYGFVRRSGGHIKIYSEIGNGTTIRLYLPRSAAAVAATGRAGAPGDEPLPGGDETVLVVDDETYLIDIAVHHLEDLGYRTLSADSAKRALEILEGEAGIDLLFSDVVMPGGMDGFDLAKEALGRYPDLRVLLTSGFTARLEETQTGDAQTKALAAALLGKPYERGELARRVRKVLDGAVGINA